MTVLITGANRGIGATLFSMYSGRDETVLGTARSGAPLLPLDVTDPASHAALAERLADTPIELLVCNAGVYADKGHQMAGGYGAEIWAQNFAVNVTGVFLTIQSLLPNLRAAGGKIAIIGSMMASHARAPGGSYAYRASKAAVLNLGRNIASDLKPEGIPVGIYHPGWVQTDIGPLTAHIDVAESANGLVARFDQLEISQTGAFLSYDGTPIPF